MEIIENNWVTANMEWMQVPINILLCGTIITLSIPISCAIYPQISPISIDKLEPELQVMNVLFSFECIICII